MNILVCFKVAPDWDGVLEGDWAAFCNGEPLDYVKNSFNCFDESALEIGLRLKEAHGGACVALTVGAEPPKFLWQSLFAAGFDHVVLIGGGEDAPFAWEFQPGRVAREIVRFARDGGFDLILTGKQAGAGDSGCVPFMVAEGLGLAVVGVADENADFGASPVVGVVGNSSVSALRAVTLKARLAAGARGIERVEAATVPAKDKPVLFREERVSVCEFWAVDAVGAADRVAGLIRNGS